MWVRGLKLFDNRFFLRCISSHPMWVRGLKHILTCLLADALKSHPMWVRGLKLVKELIIKSYTLVAPYVGAWIETVELVTGST